MKIKPLWFQRKKCSLFCKFIFPLLKIGHLFLSIFFLRCHFFFYFEHFFQRKKCKVPIMIYMWDRKTISNARIKKM